MADFGYDVADYTAIDPLFGTMADFERLVAALHARHPPDPGLRAEPQLGPASLFQEARASRASPRRDWYIWRDPGLDGGPPNNWVSQAGGGAWEFDPASGQYYYHAFLKEQPDLNWRNPAVRQAMYDALRFWLGRGVDGFRVDVLWHMIKDAEFRDDPWNPDYIEGQPDFRRVHAIHSADHRGARDRAGDAPCLAEYPGERLLIGEIYLPVERLVAYYGADLGAVHLPFNFNLMWAPWQPGDHAADRVLREVLPPGGWPSWVLGNHDQRRIASRRPGPGTRRCSSAARHAHALLRRRAGPRERADPGGAGARSVRHPTAGHGPGPDPVRTPMPWDRTATGGFTTGGLAARSARAMRVSASRPKRTRTPCSR